MKKILRGKSDIALKKEPENASNEEILRRIGPKAPFSHRIKTRQLKYLGRVLSKECLQNLTLTVHSDDKRDLGKQRVNYLTSLCKWIAEQEMGMIVYE